MHGAGRAGCPPACLAVAGCRLSGRCRRTFCCGGPLLPPTTCHPPPATHPPVWDTLSFASNGLVFFWAGVASINYFIRRVRGSQQPGADGTAPERRRACTPACQARTATTHPCSPRRRRPPQVDRHPGQPGVVVRRHPAHLDLHGAHPHRLPGPLQHHRLCLDQRACVRGVWGACWAGSSACGCAGWLQVLPASARLTLPANCAWLTLPANTRTTSAAPTHAPQA